MKGESQLVDALRRAFTAKTTARMLDSVDVQYLRAESAEVLTRLARFQSSNAFLRQLEQRKAERGGLRGDQEREALAHADSLAGDVRAIVRGGLKTVKHLHVNESLDGLLQGWKGVVKKHEGVTAADAWQAILRTPDMKPFLTKKGVDGYTLSQITATAEGLDRTFQVIDDRLFVNSPCGEFGPRPIRFSGKPAGLSAERLWRQDSLDALLAVLASPAPLGAVAFGQADGLEMPQDLTIDLLEIMAVEAASAVEQTDALVGLIEHAGLPAYRGGDPWLGALVGFLALVTAVVGVVITIGCWIGEEDFASEGVCEAGNWMTLIGLLLFLGGSCASDSSCRLEIVPKTNAKELLANDSTIGPLA